MSTRPLVLGLNLAIHLLAAAALTACGGGGSDSGAQGPQAPFAAASDASEPAPSASARHDATAQRVLQRDAGLGDLVDRATPITTPVVTPIANPTANPIANPIAKPVANPITTPIVTPVADLVTTPVAKPITSPALQTAANQLDSFTLPGYPHAVDVYRPNGATRAIVFLHGGGGTQQTMAYQMGLKTTYEDPPTQATVNWAALANAKVIAVFPQGQSMTGDARTWNNHTMDSGQDDVGFLRSLSAALRARYGISQVALAGHSMGGAMVNRMRCEASEPFQSYVSISGPASSFYLGTDTACARGTQSSYLGLFGSADPVIPGAWDAPTWLVNLSVVGFAPTAFVNPLMVGEWQAFQHRAQLMCGETPSITGQSGSTAAPRWSACGGRLQVQLAMGADHGIASIAGVIGKPPFQLVADFTAKA